LIVVSIFDTISSLQAQDTDAILDQVMLLRQFVGTWENEYKQDTSIVWILKPYGKGLEAVYKFTTKGKTLREAKQLVGFDNEFNTFTNFTLINNGRFVTFRGKFIEKNKMWLEARDKNNPEKALSRGIYEFKNPDIFTVNREFGNYGARPGTYYRINK